MELKEVRTINIGEQISIIDEGNDEFVLSVGSDETEIGREGLKLVREAINRLIGKETEVFEFSCDVIDCDGKAFDSQEFEYVDHGFSYKARFCEIHFKKMEEGLLEDIGYKTFKISNKDIKACALFIEYNKPRVQPGCNEFMTGRENEEESDEKYNYSTVIPDSDLAKGSRMEEAGMSVSKIASELGYNYQTFFTALRKYQKDNEGGDDDSKFQEDSEEIDKVEEVLDEYFTDSEMRAVREIARDNDVDVERVKNFLLQKFHASNGLDKLDVEVAFPDVDDAEKMYESIATRLKRFNIDYHRVPGGYKITPHET